MGCWKLKKCPSAVFLKLFKNARGNNMEEGTNNLKWYTYIFVLFKFFCEITDWHWIINGKTFFIYGIGKKIQLNIRSASQIVQKFSWELKSQEELIF